MRANDAAGPGPARAGAAAATADAGRRAAAVLLTGRIAGRPSTGHRRKSLLDQGEADRALGLERAGTHSPYLQLKGCWACLMGGRGGRFIGGMPMELEKYTERSKGFVQSAQNLALRSGHQRLTPEHLLKVLLDDKEGLCANLIRAAGGDPRRCWQAVEAELDAPAEGRGQRRRPGLSVARNWRGSSTRPRRSPRRPATALSRSSGCCWRWRWRRRRRRARRWPPAGVTPQSLNARDRAGAQGPQGRQRLGRGRLRRAEEIRPRPDRGGARGQARPGDRPRRGDPPHDPGAVAPHQEQSRC